MTEEQLKKRAEEYAKKIEKELLEDYEPREYGTTPYLATIPTPYNRQAFIDGYHECQKEHEWHYVKDEGTPTKEGHYLVCLRNKDHDIFDCWIFVSDNVPYSLKVRMIDIYAWKEIVLPKESE